jgi:poly(hydroxyalkanoate) granule-associated protein
MPKATGKQKTPQQAPAPVEESGHAVVVESAGLFLAARRVLLASLGAVAIGLEEGNEFIERLVERGEVAEADLTRLVNETIERSNQREARASEERKSTVDKAAMAIADSVEVILSRLNVPTKTDIEELSRKINYLNEKVMALRQRNRAAALRPIEPVEYAPPAGAPAVEPPATPEPAAPQSGAAGH